MQAMANALINNGPPMQSAGISFAPIPDPKFTFEMGGSMGQSVRREQLNARFLQIQLQKIPLKNLEEPLSAKFNKAAGVLLEKQGKELSRKPTKSFDKLKENFKAASMER